jgi:PadR family transcriptional regulator, regulatory protein AphA
MSSTNTTRYAILGLLTIQPMSGYDLRKHLGESLNFFWAESNGQIYPTLKKLMADEWIIPIETQQCGRRTRQQYALTPVGRNQLKKWLAKPPHIQPPRNELILKLFLGRSAQNGALLQHVNAFKRRHEEVLGLLLNFRKTIPTDNARSPDLDYWMLCLEHGIRLRQAEVKWCSVTLAELGSSSQRNRR